MIAWIKYTAKAWVAGIGGILTAFVVEYLSTPEAGTVINGVVQHGFNMQDAGIKAFISGAILWVITYWVRNAKKNDTRASGSGKNSGVVAGGGDSASDAKSRGLDNMGHKA